MTTPYNTITCHSASANALATRPSASNPPPIRMSFCGPSRSTSTPTSGDVAPVTSCDTE
jgi:hypothetical protein